MQENKSVPKDTVETVLVKTTYFDTLLMAAVTNPVIDPVGAYGFDPSMLIVTSSSGYPYLGQFTSYTFSQMLVATSLVVSIPVDSIFIQPLDSIADTNSVAQVKAIPKLPAKKLPEPESSVTPYIASGIGAAFLAALFFFVLKRKKKNIQRD